MKLPSRALSDLDILKYAKKLKIPHFRGVYMRDSLPTSSSPPKRNECAIINLDSVQGPGTHWVAYKMTGRNSVIYFDSFGSLKPPIELVRYFGGRDVKIKYNPEAYQTYDTVNCGHLCLQFLYKYNKRK